MHRYASEAINLALDYSEISLLAEFYDSRLVEKVKRGISLAVGSLTLQKLRKCATIGRQ